MSNNRVDGIMAVGLAVIIAALVLMAFTTPKPEKSLGSGVSTSVVSVVDGVKAIAKTVK